MNVQDLKMEYEQYLSSGDPPSGDQDEVGSQ